MERGNESNWSKVNGGLEQNGFNARGVLTGDLTWLKVGHQSPVGPMTLPHPAATARGRQVSWCPDLYGPPDSPPAVCLKLPLRLEETPITSRLAGIMKLWLGDSELWQAVVDSKSFCQIRTTCRRFPLTGRSSSLEPAGQFNGAEMIICQNYL